MKKIISGIALMLILLLLFAYAGGVGLLGEQQARGQIHLQPLPQTVLADAAAKRENAAHALDQKGDKQILFGDLHVHTTWSNDAYFASLPMSGGEGSHPPADACDYARYCSALDFWSINDHAVSLNQRRWNEIKDSIDQCNAVADSENPDVMAFLGYEWTQATASDADKHYGHKNVIFRPTDEGATPDRPIFASGELGPDAFNPSLVTRMATPFLNAKVMGTYHDWNLYMAEMEEEPLCAQGVSSADLPVACREGASSPAELFRKLDEGGLDAMVIPHGNTWGLYSPAEISWDKQLSGDMQNEKYQYLVEVFSGHGNSEEYRQWRDIEFDEQGNARCPAATPEYLPTCVQAGRLILARCKAEGGSDCVNRQLEAEQIAVESNFPLATVPRSEPNDWLDAGQCRDCFLPAFTYRPGGASQYALAIGNFDEQDRIRRFRFGFIASSDNHTARPGTGYKELDRMHNVEGFALADETTRDFMQRPLPEKQAKAIALEASNRSESQAYTMTHAERGSSFFLTGGLVAVHSNSRSHDGVWNGLARKETYGTSGDRILLWFDLINAGANGDAVAPMGSELEMHRTPKFRVRAAGAFRQKPGCPDHSITALGEQRLERLCYGECYNPSDERKIITRIEVIRIRPQMDPSENVAELIEDTWLSHDCPVNEAGCSFEFEDPEYLRDGRETVYYVRAIEEASEAVNAALMRCQYDAQGQCTSANICAASPMFTDPNDDCLASNEERAWSSPIFLDTPHSVITHNVITQNASTTDFE